MPRDGDEQPCFRVISIFIWHVRILPSRTVPKTLGTIATTSLTIEPQLHMISYDHRGHIPTYGAEQQSHGPARTKDWVQYLFEARLPTLHLPSWLQAHSLRKSLQRRVLAALMILDDERMFQPWNRKVWLLVRLTKGPCSLSNSTTVYIYI